jgi:putative serine protease PepD
MSRVEGAASPLAVPGLGAAGSRRPALTDGTLIMHAGRRPVGLWRIVTLALPALAVCGLVACAGGSGTSSSPGTAGSPLPTVAAAAGLGWLQRQYEQVVSRVLPSVVQISTGTGTGSGVVYDSRGDIVTNAHVVGTAATVGVSPASGGKALPAKVTGVFAPDDLAVITVQRGAASLNPAVFGHSAVVRVGEIVLAMGNPLGLSGTVTDGIVSATGRTVSEGQGGPANRVGHRAASGPGPAQARRPGPGPPGP